MTILAKLLSNALLLIYMSQDPVLSMESRHARSAPSMGKETLCSQISVDCEVIA